MEIYSRIFFRLAKEPDTPVPLPVRMFLYFGHMDEQLTGSENMVFLGNTAEFLAQHNNSHIYTLYDWLHAIYTGRKEPSRNEFDQDYTDYVHSLKVSGQIDRQTETSLLDDLEQKVEYELKNMIPSVNKMVSGRISSYCPVFSEHNVQKGLADTFVTAKDLSETLSFITSLDYTVFYREYLYSNPSVGLPKESFHMEILPDILLMPGVGSRGVMWQEIEGKRRTTPSRMMLPIFCQEDLRSTFLHLVGEYRWEMCKRIQGGRWHDVSAPSLTSEYFDYLQFYRKNHDLSAENKERIKNALQKARGSFKEMFVRDYITYILYESTGSPRLSKPSRSILVHHCPFAKQLRTTLGTNPIYKEMMHHLEVVKGQQMHRLELIERKLESNGRELPQALIEERHYYEG